MCQTEIRNIDDPETEEGTSYISFKDMVVDLKHESRKASGRRYVKLRAPAVRRDGKRVYWKEVVEGKKERPDDEVGCMGSSFWCGALIVKMLKKIANGRIGALLGLPKYEI